jgi:hypothetical protein
MSHLESLIVEYLDWQGYLVRRNARVGRLKHGGWEMELDVIGYHPHNHDFVHYEPSLDADSWETREHRYQKKFDAARRHILPEIFSWLPDGTPLRQIAVFPSHPKGRDWIAGGQIVRLMNFWLKFELRSSLWVLRAVAPFLKITRFFAFCSSRTVATTMRF